VQETKLRRRDHLCIIADILYITKGATLKTQIMYKANLSYTQLKEYLNFLLTTNLIAQTVVEGKEGYKITLQGINFLHKHTKN
jgi:predicted transcriptional regulator